MGLCVRENVKFPLPELEGSPKGLGNICLHYEGTWSWSTIVRGMVMKFFVKYRDGNPHVFKELRFLGVSNSSEIINYDTPFVENDEWSGMRMDRRGDG